MSLRENPAYDGHRIVRFISDPAVGLRAIIALHRLAPIATGGIRMKAYASEDEALRDALRLSRAMSYKSAFAGIDSGGGKTVVIADPRTQKTDALLRSLGRAIDQLKGLYYGAPDVGTGAEDMRTLREVTNFVYGAHPDHGDSSPATAYGVLQGIRAAVSWRLGRESLEGVVVAVQGLGNVGTELCRLLAAEGARLRVADVNPAAAEAACARFAAEAVSPDEILFEDADVLAPCALGGVINVATAPRIRAPIVCGGANNQLEDDSLAHDLAERGVLFVPDYIVSAGGIINGVAEGAGGYDKGRVWTRIETIRERCLEVFHLADARSCSAQAAADAICRSALGA